MVKLRRPLRTVIICIAVVSLLLILASATVLYLIVQPTNDRDNRDARKQKEMLAIVLDTCDLAPIPKSARISMVRTEGGMFTRSFRVAFSADAQGIRSWLQRSNGIRTVTPRQDGPGRRYVLRPKYGYQYADVVVTRSSATVEVYLSWS